MTKTDYIKKSIARRAEAEHKREQADNEELFRAKWAGAGKAEMVVIAATGEYKPLTKMWNHGPMWRGIDSESGYIYDVSFNIDEALWVAHYCFNGPNAR